MDRGNLIAFDPGARAYAYAVFERRELRLVGKLAFDLCIPLELREINRGKYDSILIECPQVYAQRKTKGDPNDLIDVAVSVGRLFERSSRLVLPKKIELVRPRVWKGTTPKEIFFERIRRCLSPSETCVLDGLKKRELHDILDAIGLGLWGLNRLGSKF